MKASRAFKFKPADIRNNRQRLQKSQSEFAMMIGVSVSTLQNWEQGRRKPEGTARVLLIIASENLAQLLNLYNLTGSITDSFSFICCSVYHKSYACCMCNQSPGPLPVNLPILSAISVVIG